MNPELNTYLRKDQNTDQNADQRTVANKDINANPAATHSRSQHALVVSGRTLLPVNTLRIVLLTHDTELSKASNSAGLAFDELAALRCQEPSSSELGCLEPNSPEQGRSEQRAALISASKTNTIAKQPQLLNLVLEQVVWQRKASDHHHALRRVMAPSATPRYLLFPAPHATMMNLQDVVATHLQIQQLIDGHRSQPIAIQQQANTGSNASLELIILDATWQRARKMYRQSPYLQQMPTWQFCHAPASQFARRRNQVEGGWCTAEMIAMVWQLFGCDNASLALQQRFAEFNQR